MVSNIQAPIVGPKVGNHVPRSETISHGGKTRLIVGDPFRRWAIIFRGEISCLPSPQTPIHSGGGRSPLKAAPPLSISLWMDELHQLTSIVSTRYKLQQVRICQIGWNTQSKLKCLSGNQAKVFEMRRQKARCKPRRWQRRKLRLRRKRWRRETVLL